MEFSSRQIARIKRRSPRTIALQMIRQMTISLSEYCSGFWGREMLRSCGSWLRSMIKSPFKLAAPQSCTGSRCASSEFPESLISVKRREQSKWRKCLLPTTRLMMNRAPRLIGSSSTTIHDTLAGAAAWPSFDLCNASTLYLRLFFASF